MQRPKFGVIIAAAALAGAAVVPLLATPASAADTCDAGQFPASFAAQSGLKVDCHTDAGTNVNHVEIHDAENVQWHHTAARNATLDPASGNATTAGSATIHFAAGAIQTRDIRRPISGFTTANATVFKGGAFITSVAPVNCTTACTSATLSQTASVTIAAVTARIDMTTNRTLSDATCTAGTNTVSSNSAKFVAGDVGKSVSGGPFPSGTFISSVTATTATLNQTHTAGCTAGRLITIGGAKYVSGSPVLFNGDPEDLDLSNTTLGGQGFSCTSGSHTLSMTAAAKTDTGGFVTTDAGITVVIKGSTTTVTTTASAAVLTGNTSLTLVGTCPAGVSATVGNAAIGVASRGAALNGAPVMTLSAVLNLNPVLVATQDECSANTFEGFQVVGGWQNPGSYTALAQTPVATVGQVVFPTSVISFSGFVVPKHGGDTANASPHFNFSFPLLPTSLAVCLSAGAPANPVQLAFGINPTVKASAPFLPTGSGNPGDPQIRQLLPETGSFSQIIELLNASTVVVSDTGTACTIGADTAAPGLACGDG
jgi:hypothetical protein